MTYFEAIEEQFKAPGINIEHYTVVQEGDL